jgi:hypothetical protein
MSPVKPRPALLLAILLYVTLDLSLPAMPGAFVFDSSDSVESIRIRARAAVEIVVLPAPVPDAIVLSRPPLDVKDQLTPAESVPRGRRPALSWRSWALHDPAPPSEDPH